MTAARYLIGDTRQVLATLPDASVDLVLGSPPFLGLRSYLPADDPNKPLEMGSEPTPGEFIDALLDVVVECRRVLAPHGSLCFELGDTYSGSGGAGGDYNEGGLRADAPKFTGSAMSYRKSAQRGRSLAGWPLDKSLTLIPESFRFALAYGRNPHTGRTIQPWRVRNVIRWCRPNPPVGALGDKFRPATSEMVVACTSRARYFDLDAVRGPGSENTHARTAKGVESRPSTGKTADDERRGGNFSTLATLHDTAGAPPLDWWNIPTQPYAGSHYATWPEQLCVRPIRAMCPTRVCTTCGKPSERIVESYRTLDGEAADLPPISTTERAGGEADGIGHWRKGTVTNTLGWTDCGHGGTWRTGVVLDPFAGSGTTLAVATGHGRDAIGIDLDARNAALAEQRIGMFCTVEDHRPSNAGAA